MSDTATDVSTGADKDFVLYVVRSIVTEPDKVEVVRTVDEKGVLLTLKVGKDDMGKVVGRGGQTAKSIRILLRVIGARTNSRVNLKIVEPDGSTFVGAGANEEATGGVDSSADLPS
ncbi:KH domain-containing protein [Candidatus Peregrinibacteria bacterium]|nr:KH domain-containing protein [Candidatus Peregrinibacteria bacterium]